MTVRMKDATASPAATQLMEAADSEEVAFHSVEEKEEGEDVEQEEEERKEGEEKVQASSTHTSDSSDSNKKDTGIHQHPAGDCLVCFEPLVTSNYAEYSLNPHSTSSSSSSLQRQPQQEKPHTNKEEKGGGDENDDTSKNAKTDAISATADSASIDAASDLSRSKKTDSQTPSSSADVKDSHNNDNTNEQVIWYPAKFCKDCIEELQAVQFQRYCDAVANTNCAREQRALLKRGPPINLRDRMAFPESNDEEIHSLWYAADNEVRSAKLKGSLEGEKRKALWTWLEQFLIVDEKVEDDVNGKKAENS